MRGATYFAPWGFSINEGQVPNIHVSWNLCGMRRFYFYLCLAPFQRFSFSFPWWPQRGRKQVNG
jgi:hypothetical protein